MKSETFLSRTSTTVFNIDNIKGVVHFSKKKIANNLLTHMSFKMFFSRKEIKVFDENIPGFFSI